MTKTEEKNGVECKLWTFCLTHVLVSTYCFKHCRQTTEFVKRRIPLATLFIIAILLFSIPKGFPDEAKLQRQQERDPSKFQKHTSHFKYTKYALNLVFRKKKQRFMVYWLHLTSLSTKTSLSKFAKSPTLYIKIFDILTTKLKNIFRVLVTIQARPLLFLIPENQFSSNIWSSLKSIRAFTLSRSLKKGPTQYPQSHH